MNVHVQSIICIPLCIALSRTYKVYNFLRLYTYKRPSAL